jgi:hypothetical protein
MSLTVVAATATALSVPWLLSRAAECPPTGCAVLLLSAVVLRRTWRCCVRPAAVALHYDTRPSSTMSRLLSQLHTLRRGYSPPPWLVTGVLQSVAAEFHDPAPECTPYVRQTIQLPALNFGDDDDDADDDNAAGPCTGAAVAAAETAAPATRRRQRTACCPIHVPPGVVSVDWLSPDPTAARCALEAVGQAALRPERSASTLFCVCKRCRRRRGAYRRGTQGGDLERVCLLVPGLTGSSASAYIRRVAVLLARAGVRVGTREPLYAVDSYSSLPPSSRASVYHFPPHTDRWAG